MKRWLMLVVLAVLAAGCYPDSKGKELESKVEDLHEWATQESVWSLAAYEKFRVLYGDTAGLPPELLRQVQEDLVTLCKMLDNVDDAECEKVFGPGEVDVKTPPPPKKYPPPDGD